MGGGGRVVRGRRRHSRKRLLRPWLKAKPPCPTFAQRPCLAPHQSSDAARAANLTALTHFNIRHHVRRYHYARGRQAALRQAKLSP